MKKPDIVLLTDHTDTVFLNKLLGPHKVAHELRKAGFHVVVVNHLSVFTLDEICYLLENLISEHTLYVGINSFWYRDLSKTEVSDTGHVTIPFIEKGSFLPHGKKFNHVIKDLIKKINPDCKIVLGGPDATEAEWNKDYDIVQCGYQDVGSVRLANYLQSGGVLEKTHKSVFGYQLMQGDTPEEYDISAGTMDYADHDVILDGECLPLEVSRGCIFRCDFCAFPLNGKEKLDFIRAEDQLLKELIENYERFKVTRYMFVDDTFNDSEQKVQMMHRISKQLPFKLEYWAYSRLDLMARNPYTMDLQIESGQRGFFFGIETFNYATSLSVSKGMNKTKLIDALHYLKKTGGDSISIHGSFIVGLPKESEASVRETFEILLDPTFPLDSWWFHPFMLENKNLKTNKFLSKMALDPEAYGYTITGEFDNHYHWKNEHMTSQRAFELVQEFRQRGESVGRRALQPVACFWMSGLGLDLGFSLNKPIIDIDWYTVTQAKERRAKEYKNKLFNILEIPWTNV